jgi:predicted amidophosphoribosyltransferase
LLIRGFNQSAVIAGGIAGVSGLKVLENAIERVENHHSQTRKGREERWETIRMDFKANQEWIKDKQVVLVDDVCTTGATAEVCASALKNAGAASVGLLTLAVAGERYL